MEQLLCLYFIFEDNGPHYHNTGFLVYLSEVNQAFNLTLVEYNNFEAGEGKTVLDTHFAHISHKIVRWVRVGNNLESGEQLGDLLMVSWQCQQHFIPGSHYLLAVQPGCKVTQSYKFCM